MVAVIHQADSLRRALNYNENKVEEEVAECFYAGYYLKDAIDLSFTQKLSRLQNLAALNPRTKVNAVHISLNFDPSEKLDLGKLQAIATDYLVRIGFSGQPFLLYQHRDAGHPHVHLLTTNIRPDGSRISLHNLGRDRSEPARKAIEIEYGLVRAEDKVKQSMYELQPIDARAEYGKGQTKRAITGILRTVLKDYKFASLAELNAVLGLYNVTADRGSADSRTYKTGGLVYRILGSDRLPVGTPIKASAIYDSPTLKRLESLYLIHEKARQPLKKKLAAAIDFAIARNSSPSLRSLADDLQQKGIDLIERRNTDGILYGITYVDHSSGAVFNGSALGKEYSAAAIQRRCGIAEQRLIKENSLGVTLTGKWVQPPHAPSRQDSGQPQQHNIGSQEKGLLETLFEVEQSYNPLPQELSTDRKKKRKRKGRRI